MAKLIRNRPVLAALSLLVIVATFGVTYKVAHDGGTVGLPGITVDLPGMEVSSPACKWVLSNVAWNTTTNRVSGTLVMTETAPLSDIRAGTLEFGTYDPSTLPLVIVKHATPVQPVHDSTAKTLTWEFTGLQVPSGERFAGVFVSGGAYRRTGTRTVSVPLDVALAMAHD